MARCDEYLRRQERQLEELLHKARHLPGMPPSSRLAALQNFLGERVLCTFEIISLVDVFISYKVLLSLKICLVHLARLIAQVDEAAAAAHSGKLRVLAGLRACEVSLEQFTQFRTV